MRGDLPIVGYMKMSPLPTLVLIVGCDSAEFVSTLEVAIDWCIMLADYAVQTELLLKNCILT